MLEYWHNKSKTEKTLWKYFSVLVIMMIGVIILPKFGWIPSRGHSMEPVLPYIGGFCKVETEKTPQVGDIILFHAPNDDELCFKRVKTIYESSYYVKAENFGWTGEDSDHYGPVSAELVEGVVTDIFSLDRVMNNLTPSGRLMNLLTLSYADYNIIVINEHNYATEKAQKIHVVHGSSELILEGSLVSYDGETIIYKQDDKRFGFATNIVTGETSVAGNEDLFIKVLQAQKLEFEQTSEDTYSIDGLTVTIQKAGILISDGHRSIDAPLDPEIKKKLEYAGSIQ